MLLEVENKLAQLKTAGQTLNEIGIHFDIEVLEKRISELEFKMQEPDFWNDSDKATEVTQETKRLKDKLGRYNSLIQRIDDVKVLAEIGEDDEETEKEVIEEVNSILNEIEEFRIETMLCGEYDTNNAILTLHTGVGGADANDWTEMLLRMYMRYCEKKGYSVEVIDSLPGDEAGIKSATISIKGEYAYGYLKAEKGIHRLVRISPFNANGKRQTSFASVEVMPELTKDQDIEINPKDLRVDTYRSSGAGGQHVNKTESAIRITHIPTGIVVTCQNERSQYSNKETAMNVLKSKLIELKERAHKEKIEDLTGELKDMGWGSQIRSYVFHPYSMVKDHRTLLEISNVTAVMDGGIEPFIIEYLKQQAK
ncbi:MAG: peptide chain release factor 2 [Inconstantimicrobium porci]|uniref:Peptide chain release factor 2 n=1 Tax=Inconstantimicrobium porci TaxID=2652291 RepID=A0A7X2MXH0_9CLOT|nr:peptide chain release factor 2 [Inconstantimicrobium porci]MDY5910947.1 peptide chain release factor 2 [Inconstantimicrobium porci]MSR90896.1 peptide chain release factor 2 [Inconstantimicrobium porci]